jgi:hypothetical protein
MGNQLTTDAPDGTQTIAHEEYLSRLDLLAERWQNYEGVGLEIRHEMGKLLNDSFGPPTKRQDRGKGTLKEAAEKLKTTESELSRMRWFAHLFRSSEDLGENHTDVTTWTAVKQLL